MRYTLEATPGAGGAGTGMRAARRLAGEGRPVLSSVCGRTRKSLPRRGVKEAGKTREEATVTLCFPGEKAVTIRGMHCDGGGHKG